MIFVILVSVLTGYIYEDSDSLIVNDDSLTICGSHNYNIKVHVTTRGKLLIRQWNGTDSTGWLFLNAPLIYIQDSSLIKGSELGYWGGNISHPDGYGTGYGNAGGMSGGAGGGAGYGGNGGVGGDNYGGAGGIRYGDPQDSLINIGSGGGAGRLGAVDGLGGHGGGKVCLWAQKIIIDSSNVETNGQRGYDGSLEAGGAGSGGGIMLRADSTVIHNSVIQSNGGNGGDASFGGGGGAGGGRIKIFYSTYLDTSGLDLSVQGGAAGIGDSTLPQSQPGRPGTIYIGQAFGIRETVFKPANKVTIHSNPIKNTMRISCNNVPLTLQLYDISGRIVKTFPIEENTAMIYLGDLNQGIYFIKPEKETLPAKKIILLK